jgi:hypothetical protein
MNIDYTLPVLDIVAIVLAIVSIVLSLLIAFGIVSHHKTSKDIHDKLSEIHAVLSKKNI